MIQRYFGIHTPIAAETAPAIWEQTAAMLQGEGFDPVSLLKKANVKVLCTTDDPADDLGWHLTLAADKSLPFRTLPSFRLDRFLHINQSGWQEAVEQLGKRCGTITDWDSLLAALSQALDAFCQAGCKVTDHGFIHFRYTSRGNPAAVMRRALAGNILTEEEIAVYQSALLRFLAKEYTQRRLVMQFHLGPIRNTSPKLSVSVGADAGGDSIGAITDPFLLAAFLGDLERGDILPKTILYNLHPADTAMMATMAVNFSTDGGKVQYGAAWWLHDHIRGISGHLDQLMETGLLSRSVGMLTDSRSFTSFTRHEYFRRILCDKLGTMVERGEYPSDIKLLGSLIEDICWRNAACFFGF